MLPDSFALRKALRLVILIVNGIMPGNRRWLLLLLLLPLMGILSCTPPETRWLRGNMHTHTFWSDGDDFPENVVKWYKDNGYDFLVMTDHNLILEGEKWRSFPAGHPVLARYRETFGEEWVEVRPDTAVEGNLLVRLKTLSEFGPLYEEPGKFLLVMGNEISNRYAVHVLAFHQDRILPAITGPVEGRSNIIAAAVKSVDDYRRETGINTYPALAHPNFTWAITAEMMLEVPDLRFFEVYNGHPQVHNDGDEYRASTERMWDIVLSHRMKEGGNLLYGLATDDTHKLNGPGSIPGKGWVMVRAEHLETEAILDALDKGEFYSSTGVTLKNFSFKGGKYNVEIVPEEGTGYLTEFIGTRKGFDTSSSPALDASGTEIENTTRRYSDDIGQVLFSSSSLTPSYKLQGDELYVRVRVTSTRDHIDRVTGDVLGKQKAWVQPVAGLSR